MQRCSVLAAVAAASCVLPAAQAALVVGNATKPFNGLVALSFPERRAASAFTLGAGFAPAALQSVFIGVGSGSTANANAWLYTDDAGKPGTPAVSLGTQFVGNTFNGVTFTPASSFTLQPSSTYWVVLGLGQSTGDLQWINTQGTAVDAGGSPHASLLAGHQMSFNNASTWSSMGTQTYRFAINAVPAPGAIALLSAVGLVATRRRRA